jgi:hypothetical protein
MITLKGVSKTAVAFASLVLIASLPAAAQPKLTVTKTVFENDKVAVLDTIIKPGEGLASADRSGMIFYYVAGGKVERTFADGTKVTVTRKTGEALINTEKRPYSVVNTGSTTAHVIAIKLK